MLPPSKGQPQLRTRGGAVADRPPAAGFSAAPGHALLPEWSHGATPARAQAAAGCRHPQPDVGATG